VNDENGEWLAESHSILNRWKTYFSKLLNVHRVSEIRQIEKQTAEPLVPDLVLLRLKLLLQNSKGINCQVVIKFRQNSFKQEVKHYGP
jgi:hypothetical protein